jgi:hypothetical protein
MSTKFQCLVTALLLLLATQSLDERAAILLGQQKCQYQPNYCTTSVPAYGGGTKTVEVPCVKKVCEQSQGSSPARSR